MSLLSKLLQLDLFADHTGTVVPVANERRKKPRPGGWELADHACRHCLGRVLVRRDAKGDPIESRCAECGATAAGGHREICCCGADCGTLGHILECFKNPEISQAVPQEILVRERPVADKVEERRLAKPVGIREF